MPNQRFQDPKILKRTDVKRPFYYIQPYVPVVTKEGIKRRRTNLQLGFCDQVTMRKAKAQKGQLMAPINSGKRVIQSQLLFKDVCERFLTAHVPTLGSAAQENYKTQINNHILPTFCQLRLCDITKPMVETWLNTQTVKKRVISEAGKKAVIIEPASWWMRSQLRGILSGIFAKATDWKLWDGPNPAHQANIGRKRAKRAKRVPKPDDFQRFLDAIPETTLITAEAARLIAVTAAMTGLRVSEVFGLRPRDIDEAAGTLRVERRWRRGDEDEPKTDCSKRTRQIPGLITLLLAHAGSKPKDAYIFTRKDGRPLDDRDLQRDVIRPAAEAAGIYVEGFGMHAFRSLNITLRQTVGGATPIEAQKQAGHASLDMTLLYTQTDVDREREQVTKIADHLGLAKWTAQVDRLQTLPASGGIQ